MTPGISFFMYVLAILWVIFVVMLIYHKKEVPVNIFGIALVSASIQPFFLFYTLPNSTAEHSLVLTVLINKYLHLATYMAVLMNRIHMGQILKKFLKKII